MALIAGFTRLFHRSSTAIVLLGLSANCLAQMPPTVAAAAKAAKIPADSISLWIAPANGGAVSAQNTANQASNPASLIKLLTTFAALEKLGPAYTWQTQFLTINPVQNGVLNGDLFLRGGGDPAFTWDKFSTLLRELRARGLQDIRGNLMLDRSLFAPQVTDKSFTDDEPLRAYTAAPDALLVDFKAIQVRLLPDADGQSLRVEPITPLRPLRIQNSVQIMAGPCTEWRGPLNVDLQAEDEGFVLKIGGRYSKSCGERVLNLAAHDGARLAASMFRQLWGELGGKWSGGVREASAPANAQVLAKLPSPPLSEVIRSINKFSNNVMARELFLSLAIPAGDTPTQNITTADGDRAMRQWLAESKLSFPELVLDNGSGLSRNERISAANLGKLLQSAWRSPNMPSYVASLPIAGIDGTARRRFKDGKVVGRAYLKSGSLDGVMAIAGYVQDRKGNWQVVVCIINDARSDFGDDVLIAAVEQAGG